jgi:hypothetical protein
MMKEVWMGDAGGRVGEAREWARVLAAELDALAAQFGGGWRLPPASMDQAAADLRNVLADADGVDWVTQRRAVLAGVHLAVVTLARAEGLVVSARVLRALAITADLLERDL